MLIGFENMVKGLKFNIVMDKIQRQDDQGY